MTQFQCGPSAIEEFNTYETIKRFDHFVRVGKRKITGSGIITACQATNTSQSGYEEEYTIEEGITELADNCFSGKNVSKISLPLSLLKIGNNCFEKTKLKSLDLPDYLEGIGSGNLPLSLVEFSIPSRLNHIDINNFENCEKLIAIRVAVNNNTFASIDGILYDKNLTTILRCPRAKTGDVVIPSSVKVIGKHCFANCTKLNSIIIPTSVTEIETAAFLGVTISKLTIPNSVKTVGEKCFENASITNEFSFSSCVDILPNRCFASANLPSYAFTRSIKHFCEDCFAENNIQGRRLPSYLDLRKATDLERNSINMDKNNVSIVELYSNLTHIGSNVFSSHGKALIIRLFSYTPFRIDPNAFINLKNSKLIVPEGTKPIYQHTHPWSLFSNIEEKPLDELTESTGKVDDSTLLYRIESIINSIKNVDRLYLLENIGPLSLSYKDITTDTQYEEALRLFKYNKKFSPSIIDKLEETVCHSWSYKYRLKLIQDNLMSQSAPLSLAIPENNREQETTVNTTPISQSTLDVSIPIADEDIHFQNILKHLQNELTIAHENVKIAVSWFTNFALFAQIKEMALDGIRIQLITNNDSINNGGYCLDLNQLINAGVEISLVEYPHLLHDKFCIIDDKTVINGSYNWTRFSEKNYENMMVIRNNPKVVKAFSDEFDRLWNVAEHKDIDMMPETVEPRPEYDRHAFKQYITEELDAMAKDASDDRSRITATQKAHQLNPEYHKKIDPQYEETPEQKEVIDDSIAIGKAIAQKVAGKPIHTSSSYQETEDDENPAGVKSSQLKTFTHAPQSEEISKIITKEEQKQIDKVKASSIFLVVDVSGSMDYTFKNGHVYNIAKQALSSALTLSDSQEVSLWTFGNKANHITDINLNNYSEISNIKCKNSGTNLNSFVQEASPSMQNNTLAIIFTDDDGTSIANAINGMKSRKDVFWQIISYEQNCGNIRRNINAMKNASLITLHDYANRSKEEIQSMLVEGYVKWRAGV